MMASDAEMVAAIWNWLHPDQPARCDRGPMPHYMTLVGTEYEGPMAVADYLHDEADSAKLLDELAEVREEDIWPVWSIRVEREDDWWEVELRTWRTVGLPYMHSRQHDPDRKRAIVLAAYEASRVSCEVRK